MNTITSTYVLTATLVFLSVSSAAPHATGQIIINESNFTGGFESFDAASATTLTIPSTDTVIINGDNSDSFEVDFFQLTLPFEAATVEFSVADFLGTGFVGISNGLNADTYDVFSESLVDGDYVILNDLPAGPYTFLISDGGDFAYSFTITPVPEPTSLALLGFGGLLVTRRRR